MPYQKRPMFKMLGMLLLISVVQAATLFKVPLTTSLIAGDPAVPDRNAAFMTTVSLQAGNFQTWSNVLVDTGSCLVWVGGTDQQQYIPGSHSVPMNESFGAGYGSAGASGTAYLDRVTLGEATVNRQVIGAANYSYMSSFEPFDGILGLGVPGCNGGEVSGYSTTPTFVEGLVAEGSIESPVFGIYIPPLSEEGISEGTGDITFGGIDESRISGEIVWIPQIPPYTNRYVLNISSVSYGSTVVQSEPVATYTDTGNVALGLPFDAFFAIYQTVPGAGLDITSDLQGSITFSLNTSADALLPVTISFQGVNSSLDISIPSSKYLVPKSLYPTLNMTDDVLHSWILPGVLGQNFLQNVYSAYDQENHLIGFANLA
ncbi:aspartic peptidase domain-containing protein [Sparassis latifolia]|uniref:Polyporopepsin n=1 Tax=Sparassis crispa TaxID=139825 RepID=A0A401GPL3_9APHY|nr:Polyporopepsin [Sparassis crispa]GBE84089.1 Polyporopepsin [Sparassis crispa]